MVPTYASDFRQNWAIKQLSCTLSFNFLVFWGIFWRNWWRHKQELREIAQKLSASVHLVKNIRSIECQMYPQDFLIFLKGQEFFCSKLSWGFHFGSNGQYTFLNWFFCAPFFVVVVVVVFVCLLGFFTKKNLFLYLLCDWHWKF